MLTLVFSFFSHPLSSVINPISSFGQTSAHIYKYKYLIHQSLVIPIRFGYEMLHQMMVDKQLVTYSFNFIQFAHENTLTMNLSFVKKKFVLFLKKSNNQTDKNRTVQSSIAASLHIFFNF